MRCDFAVDAADPKQVVCMVCGHRLPRRQGDPSRMVRVNCGAAGPSRKPSIPPAETEAAIPCIHRGPELRRLECQLCGGMGRMVAVYQCGKFGECTATRYKGGQPLPLCTQCKHREP